jgi:hypothetical protein
MANINIAELPDDVVDYIATLRKEAAQYRLQRKSAQNYANRVTGEVERLRESDACLRHELATLRAELEVRAECRECHCQTAADKDAIAKGQCPRSGAPIGGPGQCHPAHRDGCPQCPIRALDRG